MSGEKKRRKAAAQAEIERRWRACEADSPLPRGECETLLASVALAILQKGHDSSFRHTESWLAAHAGAHSEMVVFLKAHGIQDDYSFVIAGGPYSLFGPTQERLVWMPVDRPQLDGLISYVDAQVRREGCNHTLRFSRQWIHSLRLPDVTEMALLALGGGCDCEVVMNVEPEAIYPGDKNRLTTGIWTPPVKTEVRSIHRASVRRVR
jgi:Protein of unknown function (DUF2695)